MKELFAKIDLFEGLDNKVLSQVADAAIMRRYGKDEVIVQQGQTGLGMYIVVKGNVRVVRKQGEAERELAVLGPEQVFAEMSILDDKPRSATVVTAEETECLLLTRDSFVKLMNKHTEIPVRVARVLAERLRKANELLDAASPPTSSAVASSPGASAAGAGTAPSGATEGKSAPAAAPSNGAGAPSKFSKAKIEDTLLSFFQNLYTAKAMTRFSVAILGCPVEAEGEGIIDQIRVGEVKAVFVRADRPAHLRIVARAAGSFTLHVLTPQLQGARRCGPEPITPLEDVTLHICAGSATLRRGQQTLCLEPMTG